MNRFVTDTQAEIDEVLNACKAAGATAVFTDVFLKGGEGGKELAKTVIAECEKPSKLHFAYNLNDNVCKKVEDIVKNVYGGEGAEFTEDALEKNRRYRKSRHKGLARNNRKNTILAFGRR